jgi:predicted O-methyltransferase YrrM
MMVVYTGTALISHLPVYSVCYAFNYKAKLYLMFSSIKQRIRRRLLGNRFQQRLVDDHDTLGRLGNRHYFHQHEEFLAHGFQPPINAYEFSHYSQNGEDGLILHLLARVGVKYHYIVEVGTEDGRECNSANLILNFGWRACLVEAAEHWAVKARQYFADCKVTDRIQILNAKATPENINELLRQAGVPKDIDILSIDIDSHDYWLWEAIDHVNPRIIVIEYNASFGPSRSITVPYPIPTPGLPNPYYHGASITAMNKLAERKGYKLVGCDSKGVNSFFVRGDLATKAGLTIVEPAQAYHSHFRRNRKRNDAEQYAAIVNLPLTEI